MKSHRELGMLTQTVSKTDVVD